MARRYKIEGTNDFLIAAVVLFGLGAWSIVDGWFPPERVLKKHPREMAAAFAREGVIDAITTRMGAIVGSNEVLAVLAAGNLSERLDQAKTARQDAENRRDKAQAELAGARTSGAGPEEISRIEAGLAAATDEMAQREAALAALRTEQSGAELRSPARGTVIRVEKKAGDVVKPGEPVAVVRPAEHDDFYLFNKSLAVLSLVGAVACLWIHIAVK